MNLDLNDLIKILNKQKSLIEELRDLAREQLQAIKQDDLDKIKTVTSHQEYVGRQLALLEQKRSMILEEYSQKLGIAVKHFSELKLYSSSDEFIEVHMIRNAIIDSYQKLQEDHELNSLLLKQGLLYTERMLGVLNTRNSLYGKSGDINQAGKQGFLDTNV